MKKNENIDKIDFVLLWVDGNDPEWQKEKAKYSPNKNADSRNIRYRDWDNLKYWFRGVEKFAPWVNKIYFVTCGHYPEWLNQDNPKLVCVKHSDFMPEDYLPTFNCNPIEDNLHRIKNLSEQFVYFNDDIFIMKKIKPTDFFINGNPHIMGALQPITGEDDVFFSIKNNVSSIINKNFKKNEIIKKNWKKYLNIKYGKYNIGTLLCMQYNRILGFHEMHTASPFLKSTYKEVWKKEFDILNKTSMNKFRTSQDVNQYLFEHWQFCKGSFIPNKRISRFVKIFDDINGACNAIKKPSKKLLCLNDGPSNEKTFNIAKKKIIESFETVLPEKSSYEK